MRITSPIPTSIRAIFFDAVGTLIHPYPPAAEVYARVGRLYGSRLNVSTITQRFAAAFQKQEELDRARGWVTSEAREVERWRSIVAEVLNDVTDLEACFQALFKHFAQPEAWRHDPDEGVVLSHLRNCGYKLGIASNFDARFYDVFLNMMPFFTLPPSFIYRYRVISSEAGWRKPAPQFFRQISDTIGLPPEQILYIGDDKENDFDGALAVGMHALLLDPKGVEDVPSHMRLPRLMELIQPKQLSTETS